MTGEVLSRLTTDTTLVLSVIGSSVSVALRNVLMLVGGLVLLLRHEPEADRAGAGRGAAGAGADPRARAAAAGAVSRESQDRIAESSAQASESLLAAQTVQAYTHEAASRAAFGELTERAFDAARRRIRTRAALTAIVIFLVFAAIVAVLWIGARDVRAGAMTPGELVQFVIYAVIVAGLGGGAVRDLGRAAAGGGRDRADGRAAATPRTRVARPATRRCRCRARLHGRDRVRGRDLPLSGAAARRRRSTRSTCGSRRARRWRWSGRRARARPRSSSS